MTDADSPAIFRLAYAPGVTPTKWIRVWNERLPDIRLELVQFPVLEVVAALRAGEAEAGLVRLPIDRTELSAISLYAETPVVVIPKDHVFTTVDQISVADLDDEIVLNPLEDTLEWPTRPGKAAAERPETIADAIELVAAGVGVVVVPHSLARLHHRKDLTFRPVDGAPESPIALAWMESKTTELVEELIGIVRGRTAQSSRGRNGQPAEKIKGSVKAKLAAKERRAEAAKLEHKAKSAGTAKSVSGRNTGGGKAKAGGKAGSGKSGGTKSSGGRFSSKPKGR
ncbi:LysR substrate-binding domain-containing protein [Rhodococcus sp. IEGM 1379]|uniref:LysR substrate-binding domain-containing protein n=1 Tax=Rhodococcus sp. IEGM 1379 TaxID=3047086 RepID=UPI0024B6AC94|nr:LysR substrate-binding domain-containing protein [Rhodococcus sp. IEGM 1379]MDI9918794.1 LysR substrate-binding domain-containing protein [Rhodococcus sp. IEGM 1379]